LVNYIYIEVIIAKIYLEVEIPDEVTDPQDKQDIALSEVAAGRCKVKGNAGKWIVVKSESSETAYFGAYDSEEDAIDGLRENIKEYLADELADAERNEDGDWIYDIERRMRRVEAYDLDDIMDWYDEFILIRQIE